MSAAGVICSMVGIVHIKCNDLVLMFGTELHKMDLIRQTERDVDALLKWALSYRYVAEADPEELEGEAPQLVPLTDGSEGATDMTSAAKKPIAASEGTPLLSDRAGERAHQPVGDASGAHPNGARGEVSTLDGDDFVDLGSNAIISELEPER